MKENMYPKEDPETPTELIKQNEETISNKKNLRNEAYVYKVGKIQENKILCEKEKNQRDYEFIMQGQSRCSSRAIEEDEFDDVYICNDEKLFNEKGIICFDQKEEQVFEKKETIDNLEEQDKEDKEDKQVKEDKEKGQKVQKMKQTEKQKEKEKEKEEEEVNQKNQTKLLDLLYGYSRQLQIQLSENQQSPENSSSSSQEQPEESDSQEKSEDRQELKGIKMIEDESEGNIKIKVTNKLQLLTSQLPPGIKLQCKIRRSSSITTLLNPEFDLFLSNGLNHVASAKKYPLATRQIFKISTEIDKYEGQAVIGTINANTLHSSFWLLQPLPKTLKFHDKYSFLMNSIIYEKKEKNKERQMKVYITRDLNMLINKKSMTLEAHQIQKHVDIFLQNKRPGGDEDNNEGGKKSTKNLVLYDRKDKNYEYLRLRKESDHFFQLFIQHPLSPLQAFAIALTRFDAQLS